MGLSNEVSVILLAAAAAVTYVVAALTLKRSGDLGAGLWHSTWVCNVMAGVVFQLLLLLPGRWLGLEMWYQPLVVAVLFLVAQVLVLYSLQRGDVSVATPVMGLKIILVAVMIAVLLREPLSWQLWLAAGLSTLGVICLNRGGPSVKGGKTGVTVLSAGSAAGCYALFDVLVQKWSPAWGIGTFLPLMMGMMAVLSLPVAFLFTQPLFSLSKLTLKWLWMGGLLFALQSILLVASIGHFGEATTSNVIYSLRGLLSVLAVAWVGQWFSSGEQHMDHTVWRGRLLGAGLMFVAVVLVLI